MVGVAVVDVVADEVTVYV
jgi:hypothetical protein